MRNADKSILDSPVNQGQAQLSASAEALAVSSAEAASGGGASEHQSRPGMVLASSWSDDTSKHTVIAALSRHIYGAWQPGKLFMLVKGYFDAAGATDRNCPVVTMGGYVASVEQWAILELELKIFFANHNIKRFHAADLRQSKGDFADTGYWTRARKKFFNNGMLSLINKHLAFGCVASMTKFDYQSFYADAKVKKMQKDTMYGLVFQACAYIALLQTIKKEYENPELSFFLESGDQNCGDAIRLYEIVKKDVKEPFHKILAPAISFVSKDDCPVISVADSITFGRKRAALKNMQPPLNEVWTEEAGKKGIIPIYDIIVNKEALEAHKNELLEEEVKRMNSGKRFTKIS